VDDVEGADDPHEVDEVGEVAGPPAAVQVAHERRTADRREDEVRPAELEVTLGVAGVEPERRRRGRDQRFGLGRVEPDAADRSVDDRSRAGEGVERAVAEDLDPDLGQDPQRCPVDRLQLVGVEQLDRPERVDQPAPR
jgi:hypothetical protein